MTMRRTPDIKAGPVIGSPAFGGPAFGGLIRLGPAYRGAIRWSLLPVLASIALSCALVAAAVLSGVATTSAGNSGWSGLAGASRIHTKRVTSDYLGGQMDLNARGQLGTDPVFRVPTSSPRLWRAGTLDLYTGRAWLATAGHSGLPQFQADRPGHLSLVEAAPDPTVTRTDDPTVTRTDQVHLLRPSTQVLAPGRLVGYSSAQVSAGSVFASSGDRLTVLDVSRVDYQVTSQVLPETADPAAKGLLLGAATSSDLVPSAAEASDPRWTQLPPSVPDRVRLLGIRLVAAAPTRLAAVQAVEAELGARMTYTLDSPVPKAGTDAVDDVLFSSHRGFCEQFASAEVVLLRSAGVPARLAVGFSGGAPATDGFRTVNRSQAHAWVEVWFPGVGWVNSDPTPAAASSESWWQPRWDAARRLLGEPWAWVGLGLGTLVLMALLVGGWLVIGRRRTRADLVATGRSVDPDLAAAFTRLEADLASRGMGRAPNETVAVLARRLPGDPVRQALALLERSLYAPQPPTRQECLSAATAINRWLDPEVVV
jgi:transglutaminase-like putative cysteine protease